MSQCLQKKLSMILKLDGVPRYFIKKVPPYRYQVSRVPVVLYTVLLPIYIYTHTHIYIYIYTHRGGQYRVQKCRGTFLVPVPSRYIYMYTYNCRQYCFDLLGLVSAVKLCWERTRLINFNLVANLPLMVFKPQ